MQRPWIAKAMLALALPQLEFLIQLHHIPRLSDIHHLCCFLHSLNSYCWPLWEAALIVRTLPYLVSVMGSSSCSPYIWLRQLFFLSELVSLVKSSGEIMYVHFTKIGRFRGPSHPDTHPGRKMPANKAKFEKLPICLAVWVMHVDGREKRSENPEPQRKESAIIHILSSGKSPLALMLYLFHFLELCLN